MRVKGSVEYLCWTESMSGVLGADLPFQRDVMVMLLTIDCYHTPLLSRENARQDQAWLLIGTAAVFSAARRYSCIRQP